MKVYLACALTHVPRDLFQQYSTFIHTLATSLSEAGHLVQYALRDSDPVLAEHLATERARLCYLWDRQMVEDADLVIGEVSFSSTGLGIELQIAEARRIPLILCYRDYGHNRANPIGYHTPDGARHELQIGDGFVSLMALGLPGICDVLPYSSELAGVAAICKIVATLQGPANQTNEC